MNSNKYIKYNINLTKNVEKFKQVMHQIHKNLSKSYIKLHKGFITSVLYTS
jgi:hypothetical protein